MNDEELIAAVVADDQQAHAALRELFERHAPWIARRLRRVLPPDAVEDVVQETFIAVWRGARSFSGTGDVGGWIWGIARRQAALWARKHGRPPLTIEVGHGVDPANAAAARVDLEQALATLGRDNPGTREQRELARLVFAEERSMAEVARLLDIPPGTVKSRVYTLRKKLRATLAGRKEVHREP